MIMMLPWEIVRGVKKDKKMAELAEKPETFYVNKRKDKGGKDYEEKLIRGVLKSANFCVSSS